MSVVNKYCQSEWCRAWILLWLFQRNHWNGLWEEKVPMALSLFCFCWVILHTEAVMVQRGKNFQWCYFKTVITKKGSSKLWIVQLLRQWTQSFFGELRGEFHNNDNRKLFIETCTVNRSETKYRKEELFWPYVRKLKTFNVMNLPQLIYTL